MDDAAIRELVERDYPRLVAIVALVTGDRPAAEDAVQEAIARAWERSEHEVAIEVLPAWVTTCALNLARTSVRRRFAEARANRRLRSSPPIEPSADRVDLQRALARLPVRQRETVVLRYYADLDIDAIAAAMGVSAGTVKTQLHRARVSLAGMLGVEEPADRAEVRDG